MDIDIIKSKKYKEILCRCLNINEKNLILPDYSDISSIISERIHYNKEGQVIFNEFSIDYGILLKTELIFFIDDVFIGVFDNKYIVSMKESDLSFIFAGDTESNWIEESFGWKKADKVNYFETVYEIDGLLLKQTLYGNSDWTELVDYSIVEKNEKIVVNYYEPSLKNL